MTLNRYRSETDIDARESRCRSRRKRYTHYVIGQLAQIALTLYDVIVDVSVVDETQEEDGCHVTFRLDFVNRWAESVSSDDRCAADTTLSAGLLPAVSGVTFFKVNKQTISK